MADLLVLRGRRFDLTLREEASAVDGGSWQRNLLHPGELVLSGEASSADQAVRSARRAGRLWARFTPCLPLSRRTAHGQPDKFAGMPRLIDRSSYRSWPPAPRKPLDRLFGSLLFRPHRPPHRPPCRRHAGRARRHRARAALPRRSKRPPASPSVPSPSRVDGSAMANTAPARNPSAPSARGCSSRSWKNASVHGRPARRRQRPRGSEVGRPRPAMRYPPCWSRLGRA